MWGALFLAFLASVNINLGKVVQRQGMKGLPRIALDPNVLRKYAAAPVFLTGTCRRRRHSLFFSKTYE
jgi:hypothetical protein